MKMEGKRILFQKRVWQIAVCALLLVGCIVLFPVLSFAEGEAKLVVTSTEASPGETVTVKVTMENNPGIMAIQIPIEFDEERLEPVAFQGEGIHGWTIGVNALWDGSANTYYNGTILTLTFTVKENAAAGEAFVRLGTVKAANFDEQSVVFETAEGSINVEKEHVWGEWEVTEEPTCENTGTEERVCEECGAVQERMLPVQGHQWDDGTVIQEATDTEKGLVQYTCEHDSSHTMVVEADDTSEMAAVDEKTQEEKNHRNVWILCVVIPVFAIATVMIVLIAISKKRKEAGTKA